MKTEGSKSLKFAQTIESVRHAYGCVVTHVKLATCGNGRAQAFIELALRFAHGTISGKPPPATSQKDGARRILKMQLA